MTEKKQKKLKPPKLLRGLFSIIVAVTTVILLLAWAIINYQVEQLVATRTSEYAHSIAQIAANSSADALMSDDKIQLKMLVENVAKDPYIRSATIFAEDGQIIAQHPESTINMALTSLESSEADNKTDKSSKLLTKTSDKDDTSDAPVAEQLTAKTNAASLTAKTQAYIQSQNDIPFIEKIIYQDVTAGWFKVSLNRELLESSFRDSLRRSQNLILAIAAFLFVLLLVIVFRYEKRVKHLAEICHRLVQVNAPQMPIDKKQWMESLKELAETRFQSLAEHRQLPGDSPKWINSQRATNRLFVYCQFAMLDQEDEQTSASISLAEQYLKAAVQTHGVQSQGDILSGCLIPFLDCQDRQEGLTESLSLVHLIDELLASLPLKITMRAFVGQGTILVLENERGVISGVSLSNRLHEKIYQLAPHTKFGDILCLALEEEDLHEMGSFIPLDLADDSLSVTVYKLDTLSESIKQQTSRQINYIITNNCEG